ncbi:nucleolar protein 8 isoform X2 [Paralichthys olivaceus]|uniref:nucleolar protein 8 isoform X2 n=1 Tax=Paralichthys olivaceus TaxID=8255 RepID=UPI003750AFA4
MVVVEAAGVDLSQRCRGYGAMQRLYVGGLSHTVTQKDLKDRFGKFGDVQDVELRTRRDDDGVPYKTFSYVNINISEADLKKCMTVLNKSKWKGGTLQIETAKESFLHRLTQERQEAMEQRLQPPAAEDKRQKLLDSLSKAGVDNFHMNAAVPGTEVPGHKDWVVSKFGRVLPILQLRCQKGSKARTLKYDPSKYSHNIRRLDRAATDQHTPVTQLTWEVQGGDDDISKKRRGEFPPYVPPKPKKSRKNVTNSHNAVGTTRSEPTVLSVKLTEPQPFTNGFQLPTNYRPAQRKLVPFTGGDVDSDEEIRRLVAVQNPSHGAPRQEVEEDNLEVVGLDYLVKSGLSSQQRKGRPDDEDDYDSADTDELFASRKPPPAPAPPPPAPAPSQEQQTLPTAENPSGNNTDKKKKAKKKSQAAAEEEEEEEEEDSADAEDAEDHITSATSQKQRSNQSKKLLDLPVAKSSFSESDGDDEDDDDEDDDEDYEAMFSNVTHLEISMADLQRLAEEAKQTSETTAPSVSSCSTEKETNLVSGVAEQPAPKKGTMPEDILASIMRGYCSDDDKKKKKGMLPAFQGTKRLYDGLETSDCQKRQREEQQERTGSVVKKHKLHSEVDEKTAENKTRKSLRKETHKETKKTESSEEEEEGEEEEEEEEEVVKDKAPTKVSNKSAVHTEKPETSTSSSSSNDDDEEEEEQRMKVSQTVPSAKATAKTIPSSSSSSSEEDEDKQEIVSAEDVGKTATAPAPHSESSSSSSSSSSGDEEEEEVQVSSRVKLGAKEEEEQQRKANVRRLAAIQQRMKEAEENKKLIQGALSNLDTPKPGAGKHIVFGSDDEEEDGDEDEQQKPSDVTMSKKKTLFEDSQSEDETTGDEATANEKNTTKEKVRLKGLGPRLFGGSDDEDGGDEEEDGSRFDIRPQFEGRAGQKLMQLQSHFGADERFRMDSRFLEEDEGKDEESETKMTEDDEALEEERKKNLSIMQSVLGSNQQTCSSKTAGKAKTFRDVSALHYDPSREEHAAFETKPDEVKESKSARRKKREEAQKMPEVSKEIYYDVSGDLKAVFGPTKDDITEEEEEEEKINWDQEEEEEKTEKEEEPTPVTSLVSADAEKEESGFKFSFFGDDVETESKEPEYKVENIQAPKVSWHQDPRFQDSSSEEEDEDQEEDEEQIIATAKTTEAETPAKTSLFFFFYPEDSRLTEGPRLFCRSSQLEEQREQWEERRSTLREEYRKKHKDARRKLKASLKS